MTQTVQIYREAGNAPPPGLLPGVFFVELGPFTRLWVGDYPGGTNRLLLSDDPNDSHIAGGNYIPLTGATMSGPLVLAANAVAPMQAVPLQQLNAAIAAIPINNYLPLSGAVMTGPLVLAGDATQPLQPTTLQQVTAAIAAIPLNSYLPIVGGNLLGPLFLPTDATQALQATTLRQLNAAIAAIPIGNYLPLSGGTIFGNLGVNGALGGANNVSAGVDLVAGNDVRATNYFVVSNSGSYWGSDANVTDMVMDSSGWRLRYIRNSGTLIYLRGYDDATIFTFDGGGGLTCYGIESYGNITAGSTVTAGYITTPGDINAGSAFTGGNVTISGVIQAGGSRILSEGNRNNPAVCVWDVGQSYAAGMFIGNADDLCFGGMDGGGNYVGPLFLNFDSGGNMHVYEWGVSYNRYGTHMIAFNWTGDHADLIVDDSNQGPVATMRDLEAFEQRIAMLETRLATPQQH